MALEYLQELPPARMAELRSSIAETGGKLYLLVHPFSDGHTEEEARKATHRGIIEECSLPPDQEFAHGFEAEVDARVRGWMAYLEKLESSLGSSGPGIGVLFETPAKVEGSLEHLARIAPGVVWVVVHSEDAAGEFLFAPTPADEIPHPSRITDRFCELGAREIVLSGAFACRGRSEADDSGYVDLLRRYLNDRGVITPANFSLGVVCYLEDLEYDDSPLPLGEDWN